MHIACFVHVYILYKGSMICFCAALAKLDLCINQLYAESGHQLHFKEVVYIAYYLCPAKQTRLVYIAFGILEVIKRV